MLERLERHKFTPLEWSILEALSAKPGAVVSRWALLDSIYEGREAVPGVAIVQVKISYIRTKLKGTGVEIRTWHSHGYQLADVCDAAA